MASEEKSKRDSSRSKSKKAIADLERWKVHRCDMALSLLLSGAATKPSVRKAIDQQKNNSPSKQMPIRDKSFHGNYAEVVHKKCIHCKKEQKQKQKQKQKQRKKKAK